GNSATSTKYAELWDLPASTVIRLHAGLRGPGIGLTPLFQGNGTCILGNANLILGMSNAEGLASISFDLQGFPAPALAGQSWAFQASYLDPTFGASDPTRFSQGVFAWLE
ncbi:MAG: hypothetical protein AAGG01_05815, partial [Planctomycetota bacterium]